MIKYLLAFSCILLPMSAEKRIEYVGAKDGDRLTAVLQTKGIHTKVVNAEWETLSKGLKKESSRFGKLKRKLIGEKKVALDQEIEKIIFINIPVHLYRDYYLRQLPKEKLVLFMWEPIMHARKMYNKNLHACIERIYTWDDDLVDNLHYFKLYYPVLTPRVSEIPSFEEKKFCTMISGCHSNEKFPKKYPNELYTERKKAVAFFEQKGEKEFDLYGRGWDKTIYPSYRGTVSDKLGVMKNYRFAVCYENCQNVKGYITEKIFDCFAAGVIPIYWGASNVTDYIPKDCFIDRRDFDSLEKLYAFLKRMGKEEYDGYLERIAAYLQSDKAQLFSRDHFDQIFVESISTNVVEKESDSRVFGGLKETPPNI